MSTASGRTAAPAPSPPSAPCRPRRRHLRAGFAGNPAHCQGVLGPVGDFCLQAPLPRHRRGQLLAHHDKIDDYFSSMSHPTGPSWWADHAGPPGGIRAGGDRPPGRRGRAGLHRIRRRWSACAPSGRTICTRTPSMRWTPIPRRKQHGMS